MLTFALPRAALRAISVSAHLSLSLSLSFARARASSLRCSRDIFHADLAARESSPSLITGKQRESSIFNAPVLELKGRHFTWDRIFPFPKRKQPAPPDCGALAALWGGGRGRGREGEEGREGRGGGGGGGGGGGRVGQGGKCVRRAIPVELSTFLSLSRED